MVKLVFLIADSLFSSCLVCTNSTVLSCTCYGNAQQLDYLVRMGRQNNLCWLWLNHKVNMLNVQHLMFGQADESAFSVPPKKKHARRNEPPLA